MTGTVEPIPLLRGDRGDPGRSYARAPLPGGPDGPAPLPGGADAPAAPRHGRPRVLLAPVTVTPGKPLTPSHLKGLFWVDVMYRATARLADVTYRYSPTTYHPTDQTLGFWEYLDHTLGDTDYSQLSEEEIGELYVGYRADGRQAPVSALRPYLDAIEHHGWVHPSSARVLELWSAQYARLGMHDPGLTAHQPPGMTLDEVLDRLVPLGLCLDMREYGGPVYLDATRYGLPLRQIATARGRPNYLACALRELVPLVPGYDEVVLLYDRELEPDYQLLQRVLSELGPVVRRVPVGRVPIDGRIRSARHGDWRGHSAGALLEALGADHEGPALRLGMRLYFIATLGPGDRQSFRPDLLRQCVVRAERMLASYEAPADAAAEAGLTGFLEQQRGDHTYVDPYRLTSGLLAKHRPAPVHELLPAVFL
ncbi:hypothetical protein B7755_045365 [Streptomyces sp. NBS 14/10]|uniref:hypothetical protein n=1 Tax=Streptomyces sp. NBS 14/10 TaxID=1945643 RepID=UPI0015C5A1A5|nr:hypothetical protein [Streptomyces sp. NBS 14/10]KAK1184683.1 hypothetical protein B7755_045365 [Streptomyces sp. NBS 14/10]